MSETLPALRDGLLWVGGFRNIIDHLGRRSDRHWALGLEDEFSKAAADITAYLTPSDKVLQNLEPPANHLLALHHSSKLTVNLSSTSVCTFQVRIIHLRRGQPYPSSSNGRVNGLSHHKCARPQKPAPIISAFRPSMSTLQHNRKPNVLYPQPWM